MQRLLIKGKSNDDIAHIAHLAESLGLTVQYLDDEFVYAVAEPQTAIEPELTQEQRQGIYEALEDVKANGGKSHGEVMKSMRKRYE